MSGNQGTDTSASSTTPVASAPVEQTPPIAAYAGSHASNAPGLPRWIVRSGLIGSLAVGAWIVLADYLAVAPIGSDGPLFFTPILTLLAMGCAVLVPLFLLIAILPKSRKAGLQLASLAAVFAVLVFAGEWLGGMVRTSGFQKLALRSAPLVEAIKAYERDQGTPPPDLQALVPQYLAAVPDTGMAAYPEYEYYTGKQVIGSHGPWTLEVDTSIGILNWDKFVYYPNQQYVSCCGNWFEPIGDWAYLHE